MSKELFRKVDAQFVLDNIGVLPIIDVRPPDMFEAGHIPTAHDIPLMDAIGDADGYLDGAAAILVNKLASLGVAPDDELIIYCRSGHMATEASMLLCAMGFTRIDCYRGSWMDWTSNIKRPIEK